MKVPKYYRTEFERIIALVDAYDAITSRRRYKESSTHEEAVRIIQSESGKHFDPALIEPFLNCADQFDRIRQTQFDTAVQEQASIGA